MRRVIPLSLLAWCGLAILVSGQAPANQAALGVRIRAALYDRDLNLKPVPRLTITLRKIGLPETAPVVAQTTLEGNAQAELTPGTYRLTTDKPAELLGKSYSWDFEVTVNKPDQLIELSNDNARIVDTASARGAHVDELVEHFRRVQGSVVTLCTEDGISDGVLIDPAGLVITSQNVIEGHKWIAVQVDESRRLAGEVLTEDKQKDIAIVRINMDPLRDVFIPPISLDPGALLEGERVFTIDNSPERGKVLVTGVVSKADQNTITSEVKFTDDGSPLFNSSGSVVGVSRIVSKEYQIVPLAAVGDLIAAARAKAGAAPPPPARLLPVAPAGYYPLDALLSRHETRWEKDVYYFKLGDFEVELVTPVSRYQGAQQRYAEAKKRTQRGQTGQPIREPEHKYKSVLNVWVTPQLKTAFWKSWGDAMATNNRAPQTMRPKNTFGKMRLLCGSEEIEPILPGRFPTGTGGNAYVQVDQSAMEGSYFYPPDAISPTCQTVTLEVYGADATNPLVKVLDSQLVTRIWQDFEPYRKSRASTAARQ